MVGHDYFGAAVFVSKDLIDQWRFVLNLRRRE
jgi:hypothetical protein